MQVPGSQAVRGVLHIVTAGSIVIRVESQAGITELGRNGVLKDVSEGVLVKAGNHAIASQLTAK